MDNDHPAARPLVWVLYLAVCLFLMSLRLIPHDVEPGGWPGPDLLICLTFAWLFRRPEHVPVLLIGTVFVIADLLYQRPPGLWAALVILASEVLRGRAGTSRPLYFPMEWALIAILVTGITLMHWMALGVTLVVQPELAYSLWQAAVTVLAYPLAVLALRLCGVRRRYIVQGVIRKARS